MSQFFLRTFWISFLFLCGCGYSFQNSKDNNLLLRKGIHKVYVEPVINNTYKAGVENLVYNYLIRSMTSSGGVVLVKDVYLADAVLTGTVSGASFGSVAGASVSSLQPNGVGSGLPTSSFQISAEYAATLSCEFILKRRVPRTKILGETIWGLSLSRSKPFPAANQLDVPGTTSPLINDSEFDRALGELAKSMMDDATNSLFALF